MKKNKIISSFSSNSSFKELFFRPSNKINYNPNIISLNKIKGRNKYKSQNESYDLKKKTNQSSHSKNHSINKKNNNNSNLSSLKYIRSLKFYLNKHIAAVNTRYSNHNSNDKQMNKNNHTYYFVNNDKNNYSSKYTKDSLKIEEKKDNNPKYLFDSLNSLNKLYSPNKSIYNSKNQTYRNKLLKNSKNSFDKTYDKAKEFRKDKIIKKIIKLQAYYRGHMLRGKLVNSLVRYSKYAKFFDIIQKIIIPHKKQFFNNIKNRKQKISHNTNNLRSKNKNGINSYNTKNKNNSPYGKTNNAYNKNNNTYGKNNNAYYKNNNTYDKNNNLKNNIKNYIICHSNNINIKNSKNSIEIKPQLKNKSYIISDKNYFNINGNRKVIKNEKNYNEKDLNKAIEEKVKEFQKQNEEKYNKLEKDYNNLNNKYNDIIKKNEQLLKEINSLKEKNEKFQTKENLPEFKITQEIKFDIIGKNNDNLSQDFISEKVNTIESVKSDKLSIYTVNEVEEDDKNSKDKNDRKSIKDKIDDSIRKSVKSVKVKVNNSKNEDIQNYRMSVKINTVKTNEQLKNYILEKSKKEQSLKNLIKIKNYKTKDYLRKNFAKFYYNGIFLKMTGKLQHLNSEEIEKKKQDKIKIINADSNMQKNMNSYGFRRRTLSESKIKFVFEEKEEAKIEREKTQTAKDEFLKRLKKSRGLRKLMSKRAIEKKELLRIYFFKFYRAGIVSQFRKIKRRKTCQFKTPMSLEFTNKILEENHKNKDKEFEDESIAKAKKEKEELKEKTIKILERIIFKEDRRFKIFLKNVFQRFYLKTKLDSVINVLDSNKINNKKKKKRLKKKKSNAMKEEEKKDENKNNADDVNENINN